MVTSTFTVRPGEPITSELWNKMVAASRAAQVCLGGENVNLNQIPHGTTINARFVRSWVHPWRMQASYTHALFHPGTINGISPTIKASRGGDIKLSNNPPPTLAISPSEWDDSGFAWMVLEITMDDDWRQIKKAQILQRPNITREDSKHVDTPQLYLGYAGFNDSHTARYPLVRLQRVQNVAAGGQLRFSYWQVAMFNLQHKAVPPIEGQTSISRHYFWPA